MSHLINVSNQMGYNYFLSIKKLYVNLYLNKISPTLRKGIVE